MQLEEDVPLAPLTTFRIGGPARFFARVTTIEEMKEALAFASERRLSVLVIGGGSNLLVSDEGYSGLALVIANSGIAEEEGSRETVLTAAAGENFDALVARAVGSGLWGLENLSGIPGSVGGAVVQNIGAYGASLSQALLWVEAFDVPAGAMRKFSRDECEFGYRESIFQKNRGGLIVMRAAFCLKHGGTPNLSYRDMAEAFAGRPAIPLADIRSAVLRIRAGKFPDLSREGTAGSFFKNPTVPEPEARELQSRHPGMPLFPLPEAPGLLKIPLAYLIDKGLGLKGFSHGTARLFDRQPLVIAAERGASFKDVVALAHAIQKKIRDAYGIAIEPEVRIVSTERA